MRMSPFLKTINGFEGIGNFHQGLGDRQAPSCNCGCVGSSITGRHQRQGGVEHAWRLTGPPPAVNPSRTHYTFEPVCEPLAWVVREIGCDMGF